MLKNNMFWWISTIFLTTTFSKVIPLEWNHKTLCFSVVSKKNWKFLLTVFGIICTILNFSSQFANSLYLLTKSRQLDIGTDVLIGTFYESLLKFTVFIFHFQFLIERNTMAREINLFLNYSKKIGLRTNQNQHHILSTCNRLLKVFYGTLVTQTVIYCTRSVISKHIYFFGILLIPNPSLLSRVISAPILFLLNINYFSIILITATYWSAYTYGTVYRLRGIIGEIDKNLDTLEDVSRILVEYKWLQILNQEFNATYGKNIIPILQVAIILACVVPIVSVISLFSRRNNSIIAGTGTIISIVLIRGTLGILMATQLFPKLGEINQLSEKFISKWKKGSTEAKMLLAGRRVLIGCRSLRMNVRNFYFFRRHTAFRVIGSIFYFTGRMLLLLKPK